MTVEPGLYEMAVDDYHRDPCPEASLNNSLIPALLQAPAKARTQHPRLNAAWTAPEARRLDLGSACHKMLLGRGRELDVLEFDNYRTNEAKHRRDASRGLGKIPILRGDYEAACAMHSAAVNQLHKWGMRDVFDEAGKSEAALLWLDAAGCWGRNLIDWLALGPRWEAWDYKTTDRSARPDAGLGIHFTEMGYDTQCAMQERGLAAILPELAGRFKFRFLFQETEEPYLISVVEPDEATMTMARKKVDYAFNLWAECLRTETWPGYTPAIVPLVHAGHLANRWLAREIAEAGIEEAPPAPPPKRKRGRVQGSKNRSKKHLMFQLRQQRIAEREAGQDKLETILDEGNETGT